MVERQNLGDERPARRRVAWMSLPSSLTLTSPPGGVIWKGTDEAWQRLREAIARTCERNSELCGNIPQNCTLCVMLGDQATMDRFAWLDADLKYRLREWYERQVIVWHDWHLPATDDVAPATHAANTAEGEDWWLDEGIKWN